MKKVAYSILVSLFFVAQANAGQQILRHEPGGGKLHTGETVLVDDDSCPKGQIKEVKAGSDRSVKTGNKVAGHKRTYRCIRHP